MSNDDVTVPPRLTDCLEEIARLKRESNEIIARLLAIRERMNILSKAACNPDATSEPSDTQKTQPGS